MTDRDGLLQQLADDVKELVEPRHHVEPYHAKLPGTPKARWWGHHVDMPSLLDQLRAGGAFAVGETGLSRRPGSRPPHEQNSFDCFGRLLAIEAGAAWWVSVAGRKPLRDTEGNLRAMVGMASHPDTVDVDVQEITRDVARWKSWALVLTGWKTPPWTPRASCPHCDRRGDLRIRLDERQALCLNCSATWDQATIGVLAEHIRGEGEASDTLAEQVS